MDRRVLERRATGAAVGVVLSPPAALALGRELLVETGAQGPGGWSAWLVLGLGLWVVVALSGLVSSLGPALGGLLGGLAPGVAYLVDPAWTAARLGVDGPEPTLTAAGAHVYVLVLALPLGALLLAVGGAATTSRMRPLPRRGRVGAALQGLWTVLTLVTVAAGLVAYGWATRRLLPAARDADQADDRLVPVFWLSVGLGLVLVVVAMGGRWWVAPMVSGGAVLVWGLLALVDDEALTGAGRALPGSGVLGDARAVLALPSVSLTSAALLGCAGVVGLVWGRRAAVARGSAGDGSPREERP